MIFQPTNHKQEHLSELLAAARRRPAERDELDGQGRHAHHLGAAAARPQGAGAAGEAGPGQAPVRSARASNRPRRSPPNNLRPPIKVVLCFHLEVKMKKRIYPPLAFILLYRKCGLNMSSRMKDFISRNLAQSWPCLNIRLVVGPKRMLQSRVKGK